MYSKEIAEITTQMVLNSDKWEFHLGDDFDDVIWKIKQNEDLTEYFNTINSELISRQIYGFSEEPLTFN